MIRYQTICFRIKEGQICWSIHRQYIRHQNHRDVLDYRTSFQAIAWGSNVLHGPSRSKPRESEVSRPVIPDGAFGNIRNILSHPHGEARGPSQSRRWRLTSSLQSLLDDLDSQAKRWVHLGIASFSQEQTFCFRKVLRCHFCRHMSS